MTQPGVSVVICTYNRADSLERTLESLRLLRYPHFEVVVVAGPCTDHTGHLLERWDREVKVVWTDERNLSLSRNLGIAAASGEIIAFIDDDALPDAAWLEDLIPAFSSPEVAATGGPVLDFRGTTLQARYNLANRWGDAHVVLEPRRLDYLDHPDTWTFVYTMGTNSLVRRADLVGLGGFDENYAFYLDETDLCLRLVQSGLRVVAQDRGVVHHKFLPSAIRNDERVTVDKYNVLFSRSYFSMRHGRSKSDDLRMMRSYLEFVDRQRADLADHVVHGRAGAESLEKFDQDAIDAWQQAGQRVCQPPKTRASGWFAERASVFLRFERDQALTTNRRFRICLVTKQYPPGEVDGIGRATHALALALVGAGHVVHVIAEGSGDADYVELEDGVWVHRIRSARHSGSPLQTLPQHIWDRSASVLDEVVRIDSLTPVDVVEVPNWDAEGLAVILDGKYRTLLLAVTPVLEVAQLDHRVDARESSIQGLVEADRISYQRADLVVTSFPSTFGRIEGLYEIEIPEPRTAVIPLALPELARHPEASGAPAGDDSVTVLFVGRLEPRKGIDTLLEAVPGLCGRYPRLHFVLAGDDRTTRPDGLTYREAFQASQPGEILDRVHFVGRIGEDELTSALLGCDIFVAPSRFESFGLMNLEAMRARKPVVSTLVNGIVSVVGDGRDGLLVPPDDPKALSGALARLIDDPALRAQMGARGYETYDSEFSLPVLAKRFSAAVEALIDGRSQPRARSRVAPITEA
jgi:glycosyltransferase involved in cell wall biosynthesis